MIDVIHIVNSLLEIPIKRKTNKKQRIQHSIHPKEKMSNIKNELFEVKESIKATIVSEIVANFDRVSVQDAAENPERWQEFLKKKTFQISSTVENQFLSAMSNLEEHF